MSEPIKPAAPASAPKAKGKSDFDIRKEAELAEANDRKAAAEANVKRRDAAAKKA